MTFRSHEKSPDARGSTFNPKNRFERLEYVRESSGQVRTRNDGSHSTGRDPVSAQNESALQSSRVGRFPVEGHCPCLLIVGDVPV